MSCERVITRSRKQEQKLNLPADQSGSKNKDSDVASIKKKKLSKISRVHCLTCVLVAFLVVVLSFCLALAMTWDAYEDYGEEIGVFQNDEQIANEILEEKIKWGNDSIWDIHRRFNLSLNEFIERYDGKRPVIITDALSGWKANSWSKEFFVENYGDEKVVIKAVDGKLYDAEGLALPLAMFAAHTAEGSPTRWTYLQDELFIQQHPELRDHLGQLVYLQEDFFQLFPVEVRPWNAMLLWGTAFSRSNLHIDPYNWTGTNAVFSGKKLWKLYPPGQDQNMYVIPNITSNFPLDCYKYNSLVDAFDPDFKKYPLFAKARSISVSQNPGELLIIPPGWFHQAFNEVETIAVSSQVMNSQNLHIILEEILKVGGVDQNKMPNNFKELSPKDQVVHFVKLLPEEILERGQSVTDDILKQMAYEALSENN